MRILQVADSYLPTLGGMELHIRDLAARQRAAGHQVTIATRTPAGAGVEPQGVTDDVRRVDGNQRSWLSDAARRARACLDHLAVRLASARRSALHGFPTVITVHSLWTHVGPLPELVRDLWGMRRWSVTWSAVSERAAQPVRDVLGVSVEILPNGTRPGRVDRFRRAAHGRTAPRAQRHASDQRQTFVAARADVAPRSPARRVHRGHSRPPDPLIKRWIRGEGDRQSSRGSGDCCALWRPAGDSLAIHVAEVTASPGTRRTEAGRATDLSGRASPRRSAPKAM